jgi:mono/diheme cytochrome c family protein
MLRKHKFMLQQFVFFAITALLSPLSLAQGLASDLAAPANPAAERGYRFLTDTALIPADFHESTFDEVWKAWPESLRAEAAIASSAERRTMAFDRYGLTTRPGDDSGKPLQYVVTADRGWSMNCFACHGGTVYGTPMPGAPNNRFALQSLTEETFQAKLRQGKRPSRMDLGAIAIPLGTTNGTTNAVVFGMGLMNARDSQLNLVFTPPKFFVNHDMDAPPWWYFFKRPAMYIDGFAEKGHRGLMQFTLVPENGPEFYKKYEDNFRDVLAYITSLRPPKYVRPINQTLASRGKLLFVQNCSKCHGTYGDDWTYPNVRVPLDEVGTDPVRLTALTEEGRKKYADSWFAHAGEADAQQTLTDPDGYVAPPLDGIWASAPYLHNGSVPTLWHLMHPEHRPAVWRPVSSQMDEEKVGLTIEQASEIPDSSNDLVFRRSYFDTRQFGKSSDGHTFPTALSEPEKQAVLEYLKTL